MKISASVHNSGMDHSVTVSTDGRASTIAIPARVNGVGSSINGGELLCAALATCYCNDLYREAARQGLTLNGVDVEVVSEFAGPGEPATSITYSAQIHSDAPPEVLDALLRHTDTVAEVQNTVRTGVPVKLVKPSSTHRNG